jgi:hypothetical protein
VRPARSGANLDRYGSGTVWPKVAVYATVILALVGAIIGTVVPTYALSGGIDLPCVGIEARNFEPLAKLGSVFCPYPRHAILIFGFLP